MPVPVADPFKSTPSDPTKILREAYRHFDAEAPTPGARIPKQGIDIKIALDATLLKQFEASIRRNQPLSTVWKKSLEELRSFARAHEREGPWWNISSQELAAATPEQIARFRLVVGVLNLYKANKSPAIRQVQVENVQIPDVVRSEWPVFVRMQVDRARFVTFAIGDITRTFHVKAGTQVLKVLNEGETQKLSSPVNSIIMRVQGQEPITIKTPYPVGPLVKAKS